MMTTYVCALFLLKIFFGQYIAHILTTVHHQDSKSHDIIDLLQFQARTILYVIYISRDVSVLSCLRQLMKLYHVVLSRNLLSLQYSALGENSA